MTDPWDEKRQLLRQMLEEPERFGACDAEPGGRRTLTPWDLGLGWLVEADPELRRAFELRGLTELGIAAGEERRRAEGQGWIGDRTTAAWARAADLPEAAAALPPAERALRAPGAPFPAAPVHPPASVSPPSSIQHPAFDFRPPASDLQFRPAPDAGGRLVQDPDWELPSTAGPVRWSLYHDSERAAEDGAYGYGRFGSFPLKLSSDGTSVTVMHDDGTRRQYRKDPDFDTYYPVGANFDQLVKNGDGSWDETVWETGQVFHYPSGNVVSLAYRQSAWGQRLTCNYDGSGRLESVVEPAGRRVTFGYAASGLPTVMYVQDWADRRNTLAYDASGNLVEVQGPTGCLTQFECDAGHRLVEIVDPEGYAVTFSYDSAGRVLTRSVAGNLGQYTYQHDPASGVLTMGYLDALDRRWTQASSASGLPLRRIDPLGNRVTYEFSAYRPFTETDALGNQTSFAYDGNGFVRAVRDPLGFVTTFTRDAYGNVVSVINALGARTTLSYGANPERRAPVSVMNALGEIVSYGYLGWGAPEYVEDALGFRRSYAWDARGLLEAEIDPLGHRRSYLYDLACNRIVEIDPLGNRWSFAFDAMGRVIGRENPLGRRWSTLYDARGMVQAEVDPLGHRTTFAWNAFGSRTEALNALGFRETAVYDAVNQQIAEVDALGFRASYHFDRAGRPEATEDALGFRTSTVFDAAGRAIAQVDALGYRTTVQYDARGLVEAQVDALGRRETTGYDALARPVARVDVLGNRWTTAYDVLDRPAAQENPLGHRNTTQYDRRGLTEATIDALGNRTTFAHDAAGRQTEVRDARGYVNTTVYDLLDRPYAHVDARGFRTTVAFDAAARGVETQDAVGSRWTNVFDGAGRIVALVNPMGARHTFVFDALGRQISTEDALGRRASVVFDAVGRAIEQQDARGYRVTSVFDALGQRLALVDANGGRWSSVYDARGSEVETIDPLGARHTYGFDGAANRVLRVDGRSWRTTYGFDALQREVSRLYRDGSRATFAFDSAGRMTGMGDETGNTEYAFDAADRQTAVVYPSGQRLTYGFDGVANRLTLDAPDGRTTYGYDPANHCELILNPYAERTTIEWDGLGREQRRVLANGMTVSHLYDGAGRELLLENRKAGGEAVGVYTASYDAVGNRLHVEELDGSRATYGYDASYQLTSERRCLSWPYDLEYVYDGVGNRLVKVRDGQRYTAQFNAAQELTRVENPSGAPTTFSWDRNGNLETETTGSAVTTHLWDSENRLVRVISPTDEEVMQYAADPALGTAGKRRSRQTGAGTTRFVWDDENLLLETDHLLAPLARYTDYPGYWGGLASMRRAGSTSHYAFDLQGNTHALLSSAQSITDEYRDTAFGEVLAALGPTDHPWRFEGRFGYYWDTALRTSVRARHLTPRHARWISRDPAEWGHPYAYAANNPTLELDPTGLIATRCFVIGILGKDSFPGDRPPSLVERAINILKRRGWDAVALASNTRADQLHTLSAFNIIRSHFQNRSGEPCWCGIGYSRGGGQLGALASWAKLYYPASPYLFAALTIEAIRVTPSDPDLEMSPVNTRIMSAQYHQNWYAQHAVIVKGISIPGADLNIYVPGSDHVSIQRYILPKTLADIIEDRCYCPTSSSRS